MTGEKPPLHGLKVVEFAGLAPGPFAGMLLADFGADVIRIDRPEEGDSDSADILARGKRSIAVSLKTPAGRDIVLALIKQADILIDPFRPGVLEKLGLGPPDCRRINERLIYARLTGYARDGPYGQQAGHDINYLALSGVLAMLRPKGGEPYPPLNLLADFAGGGLICVLGILLALVERARSGKGQTVDTNMVAGVRYLASFPLLLKADKHSPYAWSESAANNLLDGGAPFYGVYETKDGKYVSLGALEPKFYAIFLSTLSSSVPAHLSKPDLSSQYDRSTWPALRSFLREAFLSRTRDEWTTLFADTDSCIAPVLEPGEAVQAAERRPSAKLEEGCTPAPAPTLSRTSATQPAGGPYLRAGEHTREILEGLNVSSVRDLVKQGVVGWPAARNRSKL